MPAKRTPSLRQQFDNQCARASLVSDFYSSDLDVVMVRWKNVTTISIIGGSISRSIYTRWANSGARFRVLRIYKSRRK